jgi:uncharacterized protein (DUF58 family)
MRKQLQMPSLTGKRLVAHLNAFARYDIFPAFSAKVRRLLYSPLGVLLVADLVALICSLFLHPRAFVLFGGIAAMILIGVAWPWLSLRGIRGSISFDRSRSCEGETVETTLTVRNRMFCSAWGVALRDGFGKSKLPVTNLSTIPALRRTVGRWTFTPERRGVYPLTTPRLATGFPFGLWENSRAAVADSPLLVWPRTYPVGPSPTAAGEELVEGNVSRHKVGTSGDVLGVRPYRRGDSPRRIHWRQSAKHDRLIVCELQPNARPVIQIVLDTDPRVHSSDGPEGSREWAIRIAASFAKGWLEEGAQVTAVWDRQGIPPASGPIQMRRLLDGFARLGDDSPTLSEILSSPVCRGFDAGVQVIVTTDLRLSESSTLRVADSVQRWVVLRTARFDGSSTEVELSAAIHPWLLIDSVNRIPALLRGGWKEAQHGS